MTGRRDFLIGGSCAFGAVLLPRAALAAAAGDLQLRGELSQGGFAIGRVPPATASLALNGKPVRTAADGTFLIGFDRDQPEAVLLEFTDRNGAGNRHTLAVEPRAWRIEHIGVARRPAGPSEEYLQRRRAELQRIEGARAVQSAADGWRQTWRWPARGRISGRFGSQRVYRGEPAAFHSGTDVAAGANAPVTAPADGVVVLAGPPAFSLEGNLVIIDHGMGLNSAFLHLARSHVELGQRVSQGQLIGTVGATGRATGPHLHWSVKWNDARLDPELLAGPMRGERA
jgi:hypothetical protein